MHLEAVTMAVAIRSFLDGAKRLVLAIVKEASDLLPQIDRVARIPTRNGMFEERLLDAGRKFDPLRYDRCAQALKDVLLCEAQDNVSVVLLGRERRATFILPSRKRAGERII